MHPSVSARLFCGDAWESESTADFLVCGHPSERGLIGGMADFLVCGYPSERGPIEGQVSDEVGRRDVWPRLG
jgi:hypothetical protein